MTDGIEACCAQEVTEYDDGHLEYGDKYCVACVQGTDNCTYYDSAIRISPIRDVKKVLATTPKQGNAIKN
ncbi:MAG: hypothetical protein HC861_09480 [Rhodospirillaceae bacterium]|nr:hypothetical protein [Rhodospirillaceae bacterium]